MKTETALLFGVGLYLLWNYSKPAGPHPACPMGQAWDFDQNKCVPATYQEFVLCHDLTGAPYTVPAGSPCTYQPA